MAWRHPGLGNPRAFSPRPLRAAGRRACAWSAEKTCREECRAEKARPVGGFFTGDGLAGRVHYCASRVLLYAPGAHCVPSGVRGGLRGARGGEKEWLLRRRKARVLLARRATALAPPRCPASARITQCGASDAPACTCASADRLARRSLGASEERLCDVRHVTPSLSPCAAPCALTLPLALVECY